MRAFVAALLLAGVSAPAAAEEWHNLAAGPAGIVYADADSVRRVGEAVAVASFFGPAEPYDDAGTLWYSISQFEFLCSNGQSRVTHVDLYEGDRRLAQSSDEIGEWAPVPAKTFTELLQKFACDGERGVAVPDPFDNADDFYDSGAYDDFAS